MINIARTYEVSFINKIKQKYLIRPSLEIHFKWFISKCKYAILIAYKSMLPEQFFSGLEIQLKITDICIRQPNFLSINREKIVCNIFAFLPHHSILFFQKKTPLCSTEQFGNWIGLCKYTPDQKWLTVGCNE